MQGSFILTRDGKPLFERAYGSLGAEGLYKANTESTYRIASISKTFTATMIMQLVDEGKLSLETTIERWFPSVPNAESHRYFRNLLYFSYTPRSTIFPWRTWLRARIGAAPE